MDPIALAIIILFVVALTGYTVLQYVLYRVLYRMAAEIDRLRARVYALESERKDAL